MSRIIDIRTGSYLILTEDPQDGVNYTKSGDLVILYAVNNGLFYSTYPRGLFFAEGSGGGAWTPNDIPTIAWYKADVPSTILDTGGLVTSWNDMKGNGLNVSQILGALSPTTNLNTLNGKNVLYGDGGNRMQLSGFPVPASGNISIYIVADAIIVNNANDSLLSMDASNDYQFQAKSGSQFDAQILTTGIGASLSSTGGPWTGPNIFNLNFDFASGFYNIYIDGVKRSIDQAYVTKIDPVVVLKLWENRGSTRKIEANLAEIVIIEDCGATCRTNMNAYLGSEWGISV